MGGKKVFELMLEIGHKSTPLNKKLPNGYTHKWTAFVRGANNSKIEHCIQRVVFQLHESFENPYRDISEPPFQIKETGYAGFEIPIQIYFKNRDRPNHLVFVHDLCLLTSKPNCATTTEKLKFINPNREFEKCLIKSGAQLLNSIKKERSNSPPAKKQKSSSLIPSKDMNRQQQPQQQPAQPQSQNQTQPQSSSKEFLDVFGAPLVYNSQNSKHTAADHSSQNSKHTVVEHTSQNSKQTIVDHSSQNNKQIIVDHKETTHKESTHKEPTHKEPAHREPAHRESSHKESSHKESSHKESSHKESYHKESSHKESSHKEPSHKEPSNNNKNIDPLQVIQTKISCLSDCDRLQKIVDIIEEGGEWFNLTPKKFEFDLRRLDKKTLSRIEKCLHH